jgi:hypothetical protein
MNARRNGWSLFRLLALAGVVLAGAVGGCEKPPPPYGTELTAQLPGGGEQVWAIAPAVNLSGERIDELLQADIVYGQLQQVHGLEVIPVNRVVEVYEGLGISKVESAGQAALVCDLLGCDALLVPTVTAYDPYDPPKLGAGLQLFRKPPGYTRNPNEDVRLLARKLAPAVQAASGLPAGPIGGQDADSAGVEPIGPDGAVPSSTTLQAVGMFDAANGSVRDAVSFYAIGRHDPTGPLGTREYLLDMDRYCGFAYWSLTVDLLSAIRHTTPPPAAHG